MARKNAPNKTATGIMYVTSKGTGYVKIPEQKEDVEVDSARLNTALNGDTVLVSLYSRSGKRPAGEVLKIILRAKTGFSGVLRKENGLYFLRPDDTKMYADILISQEGLAGARAGEKVYVEMTSWRDPKQNPTGKIIKILGVPGDNDTEMKAIAMEKGFDDKLPKAAQNEAKKAEKLSGSRSDLSERRDFRKILTFTIDPENAKDFDDAISIKEAGAGKWEVGVHIADVTHYVKEGSELDKEALKRGTSVYLVDRTIPMLPEILSNDVCSLVPNQDRLTMSAVFVLDKNARVLDEWYGKTVIRSQKRFTYEEAEDAIKNSSAVYHGELSILNELAKKMRKERFRKGAISLDQEEVKFILDEKGTPIKISKKMRGDSSRMIEEFMLLANQKVAGKISLASGESGQAKEVFVYRVHDKPSKEKMNELCLFLSGMGYKVPMKNGIVPANVINSLLEELAGKNEEDAVQRAVVRSMAKAVYSTKNIGHYGLAFKHYAHFTSPIRRYPDMIAHRLLYDYLQGKKTGREKIRAYQEIAERCSEREKQAGEAERASIKYKQAEYMFPRVGKIFGGIVSGVTEWGIYVEEKDTKCEGLVRVRDMADDFYAFNEKKSEMVGQKKGKKYRLGTEVKVKVKNVDLERKNIDYVLI